MRLHRYSLARLLVLASLLVGVLGCEQTADLREQQRYDGEWITFAYPGNWELQQGPQQIELRGPAGASMQLLIHMDSSPPPLEAFAKAYAVRSQASNSQLQPTARPTRFGRLHGFVEHYQKNGQAFEREYHQVRRDGSYAHLISNGPQDNTLQTQPGFDLVFASFNFR